MRAAFGRACAVRSIASVTPRSACPSKYSFGTASPIVVATRSATGYHTMDTKDFEGENVYSQFQKEKITIGELIGYINHLKPIYQAAPKDTRKIIVVGGEKKIDTVMEYYCKKGRGREIQDIIEKMPLTGSQQGFLYLIQAYINANEPEEITQAIDLLIRLKVITRLPFELAIKGLSKFQKWDEIYALVEKMEAYGFDADFTCLMKLDGIHD